MTAASVRDANTLRACGFDRAYVSAYHAAHPCTWLGSERPFDLAPVCAMLFALNDAHSSEMSGRVKHDDWFACPRISNLGLGMTGSSL